eukprot:scpid108780/ scgid9683/ 
MVRRWRIAGTSSSVEGGRGAKSSCRRAASRREGLMIPGAGGAGGSTDVRGDGGDGACRTQSANCGGDPMGKHPTALTSHSWDGAAVIGAEEEEATRAASRAVAESAGQRPCARLDGKLQAWLSQMLFVIREKNVLDSMVRCTVYLLKINLSPVVVFRVLSRMVL